MTHHRSHPNLRPTLVWFVILTAALGLIWSTLVARIGPTMKTVGAHTPAEQGSLLLENTSHRYLDFRSIRGRLPLMPFQPLLWGSGWPEGTQADSIQARVMVPGLTHMDVVGDLTDESRIVFRLSRIPNLPSALMIQRDGIATAFAAAGDWSVPESILPPGRLGQLAQINYSRPNETFDLVMDECQGEWFDVGLEREGNRVSATVNGETVASIDGINLPRGQWGLEGGDRPFTYLTRVGFNGTNPDGSAFHDEIDLHGRWSSPRNRAIIFVAFTLFAMGGLLALATLSWLIAPGLSWLMWVRRCLLCVLLPILIALPIVIGDNIGWLPTLITTLRRSLIASGIAWGLLLASAGDAWRLRAVPLSTRGFLAALKENWRSGGVVLQILIIASLAMAISGSIGVLTPWRPFDPTAVVERQETMRPETDAPLRRGDVLETETTEYADGTFAVNLQVAESNTTIELLGRLRNHWLAVLPDWVALRLSTEPGQSGFLDSNSLAPMAPIDFTLPVNTPVQIKLRVVGDEYIATADGTEIGRFTSHNYEYGGFALVIREGSLASAQASVIGLVGNPQVGADSPLRTMGIDALFLPTVASALMLIAVISWLASSWLRISVTPLFRHLLLVGVVAILVWIAFSAWILRQPLWDFGNSPALAIYAAAIVLVLGLHLWIAGQWKCLRRGVITVAILTIAVLVLAEAALRSTTLRWQWSADLEGGYIRDQMLVRTLQGPLIWWTESGDFKARDRHPRPRREGDEAIRILCLGGSSTYGSGVADAEDAWPIIMERDLSDRFNVEVFNFGFPSLTSFDDLLLLKRDLLSLDPDVVILSVGGNDALLPEGNVQPQREQWESYRALSDFKRRLRHALLNLRMVVGFNHFLREMTTEPEEVHEIPQVPLDDYRTTLEEFVALAEEKEFDLVFIAEPMWETIVFDEPYHGDWHRVMAEVAQEHGITLIDPNPAFAERLNDSLWATWIHPNEQGNVVMADAVTPAVATELASLDASQP